jgi:hypothetical protein
MKLGVMQPYFLPYVGYFQLIAAVGKFVLYDDVAFIKGGWINRNNLLLDGKPLLFTIPLANGESGVPIHDVMMAGAFAKWRSKFFRTLQHAYAKAPNYAEVIAMLERWLDPNASSLSEINRNSLVETSRWLGIPTQIVPSSRIYNNASLERRERLVDICRQEGTDVYINAAGGRALYDKAWFGERGIELGFLDASIQPYPQRSDAFVPNLSILDFMMNVPREEANKIIGSGRLS